MSEVMAAIDALLSSLAEVDEIEEETLPDGRLKIVALVTALSPKLAKWKVAAWAIFGLPVQKVDEVRIQELQGYYLKRYRVEVILSPALKEKSLGIKDLFFEKNVYVKQ